MALQVQKNQQQHHSRVLKMKDGSGNESYHQNAVFPAHATEFAKGYIEESAFQTAKIHGKQYQTIHIADLGCASGKNSITAAKMIVQAFNKGFIANQINPNPQLLVFFNDLPSNDFNNLFGILSDDESRDSLVKTNRVFTAGVAGSFYGRLFPDNSLHFAFSSVALQWISQVPDVVIDKSSSAWNPDSVYFSEQTKPQVAKAYAAQFESDFLIFLQARGKEVVSKGQMVLLIAGRESQDPFKNGTGEAIRILFNHAFQDMISKNLLAEDKLETFNLPLYFPSVEEVKDIVNKDGAFYTMRVQFMNNLEEFQKGKNGNQKMQLAKTISKFVKSMFETLIENHIGKVESASFFHIVDAFAVDEWEEVVNDWSKGGFVYLQLECK